MRNYDNLYIDGAWATPSSLQTITIVSTDSGPIGTMPLAQRADVDAAVDAARRAFEGPAGWARLTPAARAEALHCFSDAVDDHGAEFARGSGPATPQPAAAASPAQLLRSCDDVIDNLHTVEHVCPARGQVGVVGVVVPWSFPQMQGFITICTALVAGCPVAVKPTAVVTPYSEAVFDDFLPDYFLLAEAAVESRLPAGALNIVPGIPALGAYVVTHSRIDRIALTGHRCRSPVIRPPGWTDSLAGRISEWTATRPGRPSRLPA
ncbi:aldehyde dehydrogenase family protein [Pseudonocardia sp. CA-142604]|uniref:aldehyde dehydrogenase family protein n=1 Tax=Pseudonocardia sp. CA-142604 TaxID=3240024 RepID=UPI003D93CCF4